MRIRKTAPARFWRAIEPLTGQRLAQVKSQRTKKECTEFCQALSQVCPHAQTIRLVKTT